MQSCPLLPPVMKSPRSQSIGQEVGLGQSSAERQRDGNGGRWLLDPCPAAHVHCHECCLRDGAVGVGLVPGAAATCREIRHSSVKDAKVGDYRESARKTLLSCRAWYWILLPWRVVRQKKVNVVSSRTSPTKTKAVNISLAAPGFRILPQRVPCWLL